ncbi:hypothetical protein GWI33_007984 [Rhynchophorus ferrugineus]|uniref:VWFC domain-containing protein n=1 Tax=Rhynchophorus ferrugineus TaxID=354439 RepID=A0A834IGS1_RHYFE|nr:hypothetical protein GWI33_007984 [Rhynchophorus ferrugineus]
MFCWWQDCPPTLEGPCKNQGPFSPCASIPVAPNNHLNPGQSSQSTSSMRSSTTTKKPKKYKKYIFNTQSTTLSDNDSSSSTGNDLMESSTYTDTSSTSENDMNSYQSSTTEEPKTCIVMGQKYKVGDNLPHSTGNCLECICGQGGKITCSPHQCVPAGDEINDYRQPGPRQGNDVFK